MATITPGTTPIPYTYGGHTYWLMPNGKWANAKDGSGNVPQSAIAAITAGQGVQQNGYGGTGTEKPPTGTGTGTGTGGTATGAAGGAGAVPIPAPTPIMAPALNYSGRFGTYYDPAYQVGTSYAGPETVPGLPGAPTATPPAGAMPNPTSSPTPPLPNPPVPATPTGSPAANPPVSPLPNTQFPTNPAAGGGLLSSGNGGGNSRPGGGLLSSGQGGYQSGGYAGGNAAGGQGAAGPTPGTGNPGNGYINLGKIGSGLLSAAAWAAPFPYSAPITLAQLGMRGYNTAETDSNREALGIPGLSAGQALGSILGWNNYGSLAGNQTIANREQGVANPFGGATSPVTTGGIYHDAWGPMDMFGSGEDTLAYTPAELSARRSAAAGYQMPRAPVPTDPAVATPWQRDPNLAMGDHGGYGGGDTSAGGYGNSGNAAKADGTAAGGRSTDAGGGYSADGGNYKGFRKGGFVPGKPDSIPDNVPARLDQQEFVVKRSAAKAAGKGLLRSLNTPAGAKKMRGLLRSA